MRTRMIAAVVFATAGWVTAQPPASPAPADPPPVVIKPQKPGGTADEDPPGKIIIRPKKSGTAEVVTPDVKNRPPEAKKQGVDTPRSPTQVAAPAADRPFDYWFAAAVEGEQIGYLHWSGREVQKDGRPLRVGSKDLHFTVARFGERVTMFGNETTAETPAGEVVLTSSRQEIGRGQSLALTGVVNGKTLRVTGEGLAATATDTPWPAGVVGLAREPELFARQPVEPGGSFTYLSYVPTVNNVVKVTVNREADESRALWPGQPPRPLRRYVARMDPVGPIKLPPATTWTDADTGLPLMVEFDFPGLGGRVTFLQTTEAAAKARVVNPPDLFKAQSIRLDREIPGIHDRATVVYKVSVPREDDPATLFAADARQRVVNLDPKAKTFELHVSAVRGPAGDGDGDPPPGPEYLGSSFFVNAADPLVRAHAAAAVAGLPAGATAWDKARAVEGWVKRNMRAVEFSQAQATADHVAKTLTGDCSEYAMLGAAMGRAAGVPTRTALGLVYAPGPGGKPYLAYHMWFEAYCGGRWVPLDPTLGLGGVGPGHLKIADNSWHDEKSLAPLFPVLRALMAKPAVSVGKVTP